MQLKFDSVNNVLPPTFVLATKDGRKLGAIPAQNIHFRNRLNSYSEISFQVYKYNNNARCDIWYKVEDLKLVFCPEWNMWFEIKVEINEQDNTVKNVEGKTLGESELSQVLIHNTEINTEDDILRDDYKPTVLWKSDNPQVSLLNRIMEKVPHYRVEHVDESIKNIQRSFSFNNVSIYDAFREIAEEIKCLFVIEVKTTEDKLIDRTVSVYDLETVCDDCGYRGEFIDTCSKCGSKKVKSGYGNDTTVFVSTDNLADNITYSVDVDNVKNCFKLAAGDDLMTATIRNCNPNGSDYIWFFDTRTMENMSDDLIKKLNEYNTQYEYYQTQYKFKVDSEIVKEYNALVNKYVGGNDSLKPINSEITGFASLMNAFYNTIDFSLYLSNGMMPPMDLPETTAVEEAKKLNAMNLSAVAVIDKETASESTVTNAVLSYAKVITDSRYQVKVNEWEYNDGRWTGNFKITRYSDEEDTALSSAVTVILSDDYGEFIKQQIDKTLAKKKSDNAGIVTLFKLPYDQFKEELKKYCLASLTSFYDCCQGCINILIDKGVADNSLWNDKTPNLYKTMYLPYRNKLNCIQDEITVRENEIAVVEGKYDKDSILEILGMQSFLISERNKIQSSLDFQRYLGDKLWKEFSAYRRESLYRNDNYISDGLNDKELFTNALQFLENTKKELYKSAVLQHSISSTLKNLMTMKEFKPIVNYFDVGNWLRIRVDDKIYKLRLIEYEIDFDNLEALSVEFSDIMETADGINDFDSILKQAVSISSSYGTVTHQAEAGNQSFKQLNDWVNKGLNVTNQRIVSNADNQSQVWDEHGMLFRKQDNFSDAYDDEQMKIINSTLVMTDDNWQTVKTAVGKYYFFDPVDNYKLKVTYGVIAETIVGKMILGEQLGIYTDNGSMSFDNNGLNITNGVNTFNVNPNSTNLMTISNSDRDLLRFDENGQLHISGDGSALNIEANNSITGLHSSITQTASEIRLDVENKEKDIYSTISQTTTEIRAEVKNINEGLSAKINANAVAISTEVARATKEEGTIKSSIEQNADRISLVVRKNSSGTSFEVNPNAIKVAWNSSNNYIQLDNGGMSIYDSSNKSNNNLLMRLDNIGSRFYYQGHYVGKIGTNHVSGNEESRGLVFDLDGDDDDYMCWASKKSSESSYMIKLAYWKENDTLTTGCPLIARFDFESRGKTTLNNVSFTNTTINGGILEDKSVAISKLKGLIGTSNIDYNSITSEELADGAVTAIKISDNTITPDHINQSKVSSRTVDLQTASGEKCRLKFKGGLLVEYVLVSG